MAVACGAGACLSEPPLCRSQGLSDFCSSPDSYILNLTQEETGLSSGDHTSGGAPCILRPLRLGWGGGANPAQFCPAEALSTCPGGLEMREGIKMLRKRVRERGGLGHLKKVGEHSWVRAGAEAALWGVQISAFGLWLQQKGVRWSRVGARRTRGSESEASGTTGGPSLSGEGGKCGPAPPPVRGGDPGAHGLPSLPSRFRHPELLFPLQPGRLQPLSTG